MCVASASAGSLLRCRAVDTRPCLVCYRYADHLKYGSLLVLTFQNALLILSMRWTRIQPGPMYISTTAVVFSETLKMLISLCLILFQKESLPAFCRFLYESLVVKWRDTLMLSIPAVVYMVQNNLQYVAVSNLDAAVFQVCVCVCVYVCVRYVGVEMVSFPVQSFVRENL